MSFTTFVELLLKALYCGIILGHNITKRSPYGPRMCLEQCNGPDEFCFFDPRDLYCLRGSTKPNKNTGPSGLETLQKLSNNCSEDFQELNEDIKQSRELDKLCELREFPSNTSYSSLLIEACVDGDLCTVQYISSLELADINRQWVTRTPIMIVIEKGQDEIFSFLLSKSNLSITANGQNLLQSAVLNGRLYMVKRLVEEGFDIEGGEVLRWTPLMSAAALGHIDIFRWLVCMGANAKALTKFNGTILTFAAFAGRLQMVRYIWSLNISNIDHQTIKRESAVMLAAQGGHIDVVKFLVTKGANMAFYSIEQRNIFHLACMSGKVNVISYILGTGLFDIESPGLNGMTPLHYTAFGGSIEALQYLEQKGANMKAIDKFNFNILHFASQKGKLPMVKCILEHKYSDINYRTKTGMRAVLLAVLNGHLNVVQYLEQQGCMMDVMTQKCDNILHIAAWNSEIGMVGYVISRNIVPLENKNLAGNTPLLEAVTRGNVQVVDMMYRKNCNFKASNYKGNNALHLAAEYNKEQIVDYILQRELLDIDAKNEKGRTALLVAALHGHISIFKKLVMTGSNPRLLDIKGNNMFLLACINGHVEMANYIGTSYRDTSYLESENYLGSTPVLIAARYGHTSLVKYLVKHGCNLSVVNRDWDTVLHMACKSGKLELFKYIVSLKKVNINRRNRKGQKVIETSRERGHTAIYNFIRGYNTKGSSSLLSSEKKSESVPPLKKKGHMFRNDMFM